mmetsp:Transcript_33509/g.79270  ORF Transcript_33509/g.79270 Transcript_33509/m.79270 type:complete len:251 (-) Transcript_33509:810-1562(-)
MQLLVALEEEREPFAQHRNVPRDCFPRSRSPGVEEAVEELLARAVRRAPVLRRLEEGDEVLVHVGERRVHAVDLLQQHLRQRGLFGGLSELALGFALPGGRQLRLHVRRDLDHHLGLPAFSEERVLRGLLRDEQLDCLARPFHHHGVVKLGVQAERRGRVALRKHVDVEMMLLQLRRVRSRKPEEGRGFAGEELLRADSPHVRSQDPLVPIVRDQPSEVHVGDDVAHGLPRRAGPGMLLARSPNALVLVE